jgi:3'-5' exonuclease
MQILTKYDLTNILFLDIETVSQKETYQEVEEDLRNLWHLKAQNLLRVEEADMTDDLAAQAYQDRAAIYAEFGKIVCISVGVIKRNPNGELTLYLKSYYGDDETELLRNFASLIDKSFNNPARHSFCGHNIREFDIPYLCRRFMINQLPIPEVFDLQGKKPWEVSHIVDTLELWKFGDFKAYTSLKLLAAVFGFPSPKDDIDGSQVGRVYWEENNLSRIAKYCEKDVAAVVQLLLKLKYMPILEPHQIVLKEAN